MTVHRFQTPPRALLAGLALVLAGLGGSAAYADATPSATLQADLDQMLEWFEGRFDNHWQDREEEAADPPVEHPHGRIHSIFAAVDFPSLGEHVFYVEQYSDGDPTKIYRQRLYTFHADAEDDAVVLTIYAMPDSAAVVGAHLDPSKLDGLSADDLTSYPGCEVYWTRQNRGGDDDHFLGATKENACQVVSRRSGRTLIISDDLRLDAGQIWIQDRAVDSEGNWVYGNRAGVPHKLWRVRPFSCWAASPKPAAEDGSDGGWHAWRGLELHDQGSKIELVPDDGSEQQYSFELFQAVYAGANPVPILELAIREPGKEKSTAYAWASPDSKRIGINLRSVQVGCTAQEP